MFNWKTYRTALQTDAEFLYLTRPEAPQAEPRCASLLDPTEPDHMPLTAPNPIESARLLVRLVAESDLPALLQVNGDDQATRFLPYATWSSMTDAEAWYKRMSGIQASGSALQFVVADKQTGTAVGTCLLFRFEEASARAELGYALGRAHWGMGYMQEALAALIDCAFGSMALRRLEAEVDPRNVSSARLLQRLGFTREGLLRQRWVDKGETKDVEVYGLLRHEWPGAIPQSVGFVQRDK
jgi:ribosomal-protein-alanine N-acetyltransferase